MPTNIKHQIDVKQKQENNQNITLSSIEANLTSMPETSSELSNEQTTENQIDINQNEKDIKNIIITLLEEDLYQKQENSSESSNSQDLKSLSVTQWLPEPKQTIKPSLSLSNAILPTFNYFLNSYKVIPSMAGAVLNSTLTFTQYCYTAVINWNRTKNKVIDRANQKVESHIYNYNAVEINSEFKSHYKMLQAINIAGESIAWMVSMVNSIYIAKQDEEDNNQYLFSVIIPTMALSYGIHYVTPKIVKHAIKHLEKPVMQLDEDLEREIQIWNKAIHQTECKFNEIELQKYWVAKLQDNSYHIKTFAINTIKEDIEFLNDVIKLPNLDSVIKSYNKNLTEHKITKFLDIIKNNTCIVLIKDNEGKNLLDKVQLQLTLEENKVSLEALYKIITYYSTQALSELNNNEINKQQKNLELGV